MQDIRAGAERERRDAHVLPAWHPVQSEAGVKYAQELKAHGVVRMCRLLAVLQPSLSALGAQLI